MGKPGLIVLVPLYDMQRHIPSSAIDCQQEMGKRLHWPVRPIQPIIPFPVVILWPNWVVIQTEEGVDL